MELEKILANFPTKASLSQLIVVDEGFSVLENVYDEQHTVAENRVKVEASRDETDIIREIETCVDLVLAGNPITFSYHEYYQMVEDCCKNGEFITLYRSLQAKLSDYWHLIEPTVVAALKTGDSLNIFVRSWDAWAAKLDVLEIIFLYMKNNYLIYSKSKIGIYQLGCQLFSGSILKAQNTTDIRLYSPNELKTRYLIFQDFVERCRRFLESPGSVDLEMVTRFIEIVEKLDQDNSIRFYDLMQDLCLKIFEDLDTDWISRQDTWNHNYISNSLSKISLFGRFLKGPDSYQDSINYKITKKLFFDRWEEIDQNLVPNLLFTPNKEIASLYRLYQHWKQDMTAFLECYSRTVINKLDEIVQHKDSDLIGELLSFKDQIYINLEEMFANDEAFELKLRISFKKSINKPKNLKTVIEKLNKFINKCLKDQNMILLQRFQEIFKFIEDKMLFKQHYSLQLSKRLIFNKTIRGNELSIIEVLKSISGSEYTKSLERMCQDIEDSKALSSSFFNSKEFEFEALCLSLNNWNFLHDKHELSNVDFKIPDEMMNNLQTFESYWMNNNSAQNDKVNKNLKWFYNLHQLNLTTSIYHRSEKQIMVNLLQGCILLQFNEAQALSYQEIKANLMIENDKVLQSHLQSMSTGKFKLLTLSTSAIQPDSVFSINKGFKSKSSTVKPPILSGPSHVHQPHRKDLQSHTLEQEDKFKTTIMRMMKQERQMAHEALFNKATQLTMIDIPMFKVIIEKLIDEEYIKRLPNDLYEYIP